MHHDFEEQLGFNQSEEPLVHREVAGTANRQEFRYALQKSKEQRVVQLDGSHAPAQALVKKADVGAAANTAGAVAGPAFFRFPFPP